MMLRIKQLGIGDKSLTIKLSQMLILLTGETWYGKYGFISIKYNNNEYDNIKYYKFIYLFKN